MYNKDHKDNPKASKKLNRTGSKVAIIELIYSLHYQQGVFDNENANIKLITKYFEDVFNINLGNFYQTYLELQNRKMNLIKFLDTLRDTLIKKMDERDRKRFKYSEYPSPQDYLSLLMIKTLCKDGFTSF